MHRLRILGYEGLFGSLAQVTYGTRCRRRWYARIAFLLWQASLLSQLLLLLIDKALSLLHWGLTPDSHSERLIFPLFSQA